METYLKFINSYVMINIQIAIDCNKGIYHDIWTHVSQGDRTSICRTNSRDDTLLSEYMGVYPDKGDNEILEDCLAEKDTLYYQENPQSEETMLLMTPGSYAIFFPEDVHRPFCQVKVLAKVKKIVVKMAVNTL